MDNPENDISKQCKYCGWSHDGDICPNCGYDEEVISVENHAHLKLRFYCTDYELELLKQHITEIELKELEL